MTTATTNTFLWGDNGHKLAAIADESIDLIYMDPPFANDQEWKSGQHGHDFSDIWKWRAQEQTALESLATTGTMVLDGVSYDLSDTPARYAVHYATILAQTFATHGRQTARDKNFAAYVLHMGARLVHYKRVLKPTGNLVVHCDQTAAAIIKAMIDGAFGFDSFRNEIVWKRTQGGKSSTRSLPRSHDVILVWGRQPETSKVKPFFNGDALVAPGPHYGEVIEPTPQDIADCGGKKIMPPRIAELYGMSDTMARDYRNNDGDGRGYYRTDQLTAPWHGGSETAESVQPWHGINPRTRGKGLCWRAPRFAREAIGLSNSVGTLAALDALDEAGYIHWPTRGYGMPAIKRYASGFKGIQLSDIWTDIDVLHPQAAESLGYPTQKPVALVERIIDLYCPEGGTVLDPFAGCFTAIDAAQRMGRSWIGIDRSIAAIAVGEVRMVHTHQIGESAGITLGGDWPGFDLAKIRNLRTPNVWPSMLTEERLQAEAEAESNYGRYVARLAGAATTDTEIQRSLMNRGVDGIFTAEDGRKGVKGLLMIARGNGGSGSKADIASKDGYASARSLRLSEGAEFVVVVTDDEPSQGLLDEAAKSGTFLLAGTEQPRIMVIGLPTLVHRAERYTSTRRLPGGRIADRTLPGGILLRQPYIKAARAFTAPVAPAPTLPMAV